MIAPVKKSKSALWRSLKHYHFEHIVPVHLTDVIAGIFGKADSSTHAFAGKLCRKLNWRTAFALRAIHEYKKFVYLGVVGRSPVTPSKVIDQVWHEHLLFSKAYREFCKQIIGQDFDHTPELIPLGDQTLVFNDQYLGTLEQYRTEFNSDPPDDIWATPKFNQILPKRQTSKSARPAHETDSYDFEPIYLLDSQFDDSQASAAIYDGASVSESSDCLVADASPCGACDDQWKFGSSDSGSSSSSSSAPSCSSSSASSCSSGSSSSSSCSSN
jgi:hypothetical protein